MYSQQFPTTSLLKYWAKLNDSGINGALLKANSEFEQIKNPLDAIYEKCKIYSL
jgi:hypothetical protein